MSLFITAVVIPSMGVTFDFYVVNLVRNIAHLRILIVTHKKTTSQFRNNQRDASHFIVLFGMLMARDSVYGLRSFCNDEVNVIIICYY